MAKGVIMTLFSARERFLSTQIFRPALHHTQPLTEWISCSSHWVRWPEREVNTFILSNAGVQQVNSIPNLMCARASMESKEKIYLVLNSVIGEISTRNVFIVLLHI
jgi:hypothetical protein